MTYGLADDTATLIDFPAIGHGAAERGPRLVVECLTLTGRLLRRWLRDRATVAEGIIVPIVFLMTMNIVLGDGISAVTGEKALFAMVPLAAMVGAMEGASVGGTGLMVERKDGLLGRFWVLPIHRAADPLSRVLANAVRIIVTTVIILGTGVVLGFRFEEGVPAAVAWVFVPTAFGVAFSLGVITLALFAERMIVVEASSIVWSILMFFSTGFVPLEQFPDGMQPFVEHQPVSYAVETMKGLSNGGPVAEPFTYMLLWSVGLTAICGVLMAFVYRRASMFR